MKITISNSSKKRIEDMILSAPQTPIFKLGLLKSGCTGYAYQMALVDAVGEQDLAIESNGVTLSINPQDMDKLEGVTLDWVQQGLSSRLAIENPNVKNACGCGESIGF